MNTSAESTEETRTQRSLIVLSHPLVAFTTFLWVINDHVLKHNFASWWTGKLSDVAAMVVFPLLVAAVVSSVVRSPLRFALVATGCFFSAINLSERADAITEWVMSTVIASELTMDPTDLVVLPAMTGAVWLWNRPMPTWRARRQTWGRLVLAAGLVTTIATSPDTATSEEVTGIAVLTAEAPELSIPLTLRLDGEPANDFDDVRLMTGEIFFGQGKAGGTQDAVSAVLVYEADGTGHIALLLSDTDLAPVQVQWSVIAESFGGTFFNSAAPEPVLEVDPPENELGPVAAGAAVFTAGEPIRIQELALVVDQDTEVRLAVPSTALDGAIRAVTEDTIVPLEPGWPTLVPAPDSCLTWPCSFSVWVTVETSRVRMFDGVVAARVYPVDGVQVVEAIEHQVMTQTRTFRTDPQSADQRQTQRFVGDLVVAAPTTFVERATAFAEVRFSVDGQAGPVPDDELSVSVESASDGIGSRRPLSGCCEPLEFALQWWAPQDRDAYPEVEASVEVTVTTRSIVAIDASDIEATFSEQPQ